MPTRALVLSSGNLVTVDDSGVRIASPADTVLGSFDFSDLRSARQVSEGVEIIRRDGTSAVLAADATVASELVFGISAGIEAEAMPTTTAEVTKDSYGGIRGAMRKAQDELATTTAVAAESGADYDNATQYQRIAGGLIPGEILHAVYDMKGGGTGFIGITDRRVIVQDEGLIRKKRSLVSIPYSQISMLASQDEGGVIRRTSELSIVTTSGRQFDFEFRSSDKAERAYMFIIQH